VKSGKRLIEGGKWAECWICRNVFRRRRETKRYYQECEGGLCEGEHGTLAQGRGSCAFACSERPLEGPRVCQDRTDA